MAKSKKKLFLLDGMPLVYRGHFVFLRNPRITSKGQNVSALFGFTNSLMQILDTEKPTHIAVVFDTPEPTERHEEYPEYKAGREEMPEDLAEAIPLACELTEAFNISLIKKPGYEADDIIGTLAVEAQKEGFEVYMFTPDKDFAQLVDENIYLMRPGKAGSGPEILGVPEVLEKWGIERIEQVVDIQGLAGDKVDNIPGVPGIGEKTAQKLIAQFGSVEKLLDSTDQLKGKQKEKVEQNKEEALLSKKLATLRKDVPLDIKIADLEIKEPNVEELGKLFEEYEFKSIAARVLGDEAGSGEEGPTLKTIESVKHDYKLIRSAKECAPLIAELEKAKSYCFDSETSGLNPEKAKLLGMAFSIKAKTGWYVALPEDKKESGEIVDLFRPIFADEKKELIGHHLKFDLEILTRHGIEVENRIFDTMLAHALTEPYMKHNMDYLAEHYLNYQPVSITSLIGEKGEGQKSIAEVPVEEVAEYAAEDADVTFQLAQKLRPELKEKNAGKVFSEVECPLISVLIDMQLEGVRVDVEGLKKFSKELEKDSNKLETDIYEIAGETFNLKSPKQLGLILFEKLNLEKNPKKTKTGQYQTNEQTLTALAPKHEVVQKILDFRMLTKLKSTYVDALPACVSETTGRIHTTYDQLVTATGRLQSHNPNLQNIPIRTEKGREIRKAFLPRDKNHLLLAADYSQIELRLMAELSKDKGLMTAFKKEADIHTETAAKVYEVDPEDVVPEMRRKAKMVNFGIMYGISAFGLSQRLGIPRSEAKDIIETYFEQFVGVKKYMDDTVENAQENGYVETLLGRRRYLRDINSRNATSRNAAEREAINMPIQGTAADMIKIAMIRIQEALKEGDYETRMILQVHDELVFDMVKSEEDDIRKLVEEHMRTAIPLKVPIVVEMGVGKTWLEAH